MVLWAVGAVINVVGSIMINLGTNVIKLGHTKTGDAILASDGQTPPPKLAQGARNWWRFPGNRVWLGGMLLFTMGNLLNFASFAFAAQSLLSALGVVQFISNIAFARWVNKEKVTRRVVFATAVVCAGCIMLVVFGNHESPTLSTHDMLQLYTKPLYIVYLCVIFTLSPAMYLVYRTGKRAILTDRSGAAVLKWARWMPICYALFAGVIGTQSVLYGKTISMLLRTTISGDSQLGSWYTWVSVLLFVVFAGFWMSRYSKAMKLFPVLCIMPLIQITWVLFSIISGSIYYQEYKTLNALSGSMFGLGVVILLWGVWLLTGGKPAIAHQVEPNSKLSEDEQAEIERLNSKMLVAKGAAALFLESEDALVARKLSCLYERQALRHGADGGGTASHTLLMEEGGCGIAAWTGQDKASGKALSDVAIGRPCSDDELAVTSRATSAPGGTPALPPTLQSSLLHDLRADWGVGVGDVAALMRASVGLRADDGETAAFSIWSMPMPCCPSDSFTSTPRSQLQGPTFRVRSALEAASASSGGGHGVRPGRHLTHSRLAKQLPSEAVISLSADCAAGQTELGSQVGSPSGGVESPWRTNSSCAASVSGLTAPLPSTQAALHLQGTADSAPGLESVFAGSVMPRGGASSVHLVAARAGSAIRRPHHPQLPALPPSPLGIGSPGSEMGESEGPTLIPCEMRMRTN